MLTLVCATRACGEAFPQQTLLGRCLPLLGQFMPFGLKLFTNNEKPLSDCYNTAIDEAGPDDVLVFVHDDVRIDDSKLEQHLSDALAVYDVVGVAGNRRRQSGQLTWYLQPPSLNSRGGIDTPWDTKHLSGAIMHGPCRSGEQAMTAHYDPSPSQVALLDSALMAVCVCRLRANGLRFDASLGYYFYDLDFCRSSTAVGLKLGTWPIAITRASGGRPIDSQAWADSRERYFRKWLS